MAALLKQLCIEFIQIKRRNAIKLACHKWNHVTARLPQTEHQKERKTPYCCPRTAWWQSESCSWARRQHWGNPWHASTAGPSPPVAHTHTNVYRLCAASENIQSSARSTFAYIKQAPVAENAEQGVDVTLTGEIQTGPDVASRRHHSSRVPANVQLRSSSKYSPVGRNAI